MKKFKKIYISEPFIESSEISEVNKSLKKNEVSTYGSNVINFEKKISNLTGSKFNIALNSGSSSLLLAFKSINLKKNDLVITQSYTFAATTNSIIHAGGKPWLFDISKNDFSLNIDKVEKSIKKNCFKKGKYLYHKKNKNRVYAICPVLVFSILPDLKRIKNFAKKYNLKVILDAACAIGSKFQKKNLILFSDISVFSFNGNKTITTGSGGLFSTNFKSYYVRALQLSQNSKKNSKYEYFDIGYNLKMNNLSASIGIEQIKKFNLIKSKKKKICDFYNKNFKNENIQFLPSPKHSSHIIWIYSIILKDRIKLNNLINKLTQKNIESKFFWKPMHLQTIKKSFLIDKDLSYTNYVWDKLLTLPSSPSLKIQDQKRIISIILNEFKKKK